MYELVDAHKVVGDISTKVHNYNKDIKIGDIVKLLFVEQNKPTEKMYVKVTDVNGENLKGVLECEPFNLKSVKYKDEIFFNLNNIYSLHEEHEILGVDTMIEVYNILKV